MYSKTGMTENNLQIENKILTSGKNINLRRIKLWKNGEADMLSIAAPVYIESFKEVVLYPLIGDTEMILKMKTDLDWGPSTRSTVLDQPASPVYVKTFQSPMVIDIRLINHCASADFLLLTTSTLESDESASKLPQSNQLDWPPAYWSTTSFRSRQVGQGMYLREVRDAVTPKNFTLKVGETLSRNTTCPITGRVLGGCWSSWPPHASYEEARERYADHEEVMFFITPTTGAIHLDGFYADGQYVYELGPINNGLARVVPLGSHSICFHPREGDAWGWYFWGYRSYLQKTYNAFADDVNVYVK